uniref:Uncharacterized protein n=1 Tax=Anopheles dirus TaxID=7168 RepID=A0A182NXU3_9DIPT
MAISFTSSLPLSHAGFRHQNNDSMTSATAKRYEHTIFVTNEYDKKMADAMKKCLGPEESCFVKIVNKTSYECYNGVDDSEVVVGVFSKRAEPCFAELWAQFEKCEAIKVAVFEKKVLNVLTPELEEFRKTAGNLCLDFRWDSKTKADKYAEKLGDKVREAESLKR